MSINGPSLAPRIRTSALVIDPDPVAQGALAECLRGMEWDVRVASSGLEGLALLEERPSCVVLAEWSMPGMSGLELCSRIRHRPGAERPYVIITTAKNPEELPRALSVGADDVILKPFERREVTARAALARHYTGGGMRLPLAEAVSEAMGARAGELVLRQAEQLGRIMFRDGQIVWVAVSPTLRRFTDHLAQTLGLADDHLRDVLEESKLTGMSFDRLLVEWELTTPEGLRDSLRSWIVAQLDRLRDLSSPSALFVPMPPGRLTLEGFSVAEVAPWLLPHQAERLHSSIPPSVLDDRFTVKVRKAIELQGACAAFILAMRDGTCLAQRGDSSHIEVSWALARAFHAMPKTAADSADILLSSPTAYYVARHLENDPEVLLVVVIDAGATTCGAARLQVARVATSHRSAA